MAKKRGNKGEQKRRVKIESDTIRKEIEGVAGECVQRVELMTTMGVKISRAEAGTKERERKRKTTRGAKAEARPKRRDRKGRVRWSSFPVKCQSYDNNGCPRVNC